MELLTGVMLGVAASGHCLVMCGPLMLAVRHGSPLAGHGRHHASPAVLYHAGRVAGYATLGLVAGAMGRTLAATTELGRVLSLLAGVWLVVMAAGHAGLRLPDPIGARAGRMVGRGLRAVRPYLSSHPWMTGAAAGGLTALLPCGLLYAALLASTVLAQPLRSAAFMTAYGVGTLPVLGALGWSAHRMPARARARLRPLTPVVLLGLALLLVLRAADLSTLAVPALHSHMH